EAHVALAQLLVEAERARVLAQRLEDARLQEAGLLAPEPRMGLREALEDLLGVPRIAAVEVRARAGEEDPRVVRVRAFEAAFVEPDRLVEHALLEAFVRERRAVLHARRDRDVLGAALELGIRIERARDVADRAAQLQLLARMG